MPITAQTTLQQVRQHFRHLGLTMPKKIETELARIEEATPTFTPANASDVAEAMLTAQAEGRDAATDETVRTALTRMLLVHHSGAISAAQGSAQEKARKQALVTHGPDLIEAMRPVVEAAERDIAKARQVMGTTSLRLDDSKMVAALDSSRLGPWALAREALLRVERVEEVWTFLASVTRLAAVSDTIKALIVTDADDLTPITQLSRGFDVAHHTSSARGVVEAGLPLSLATFEDFADRVAAVRAVEQRNAERARVLQEQRRFPSNPIRIPQSAI